MKKKQQKLKSNPKKDTIPPEALKILKKAIDAVNKNNMELNNLVKSMEAQIKKFDNYKPDYGALGSHKRVNIKESETVHNLINAYLNGYDISELITID